MPPHPYPLTPFHFPPLSLTPFPVVRDIGPEVSDSAPVTLRKPPGPDAWPLPGLACPQGTKSNRRGAGAGTLSPWHQTGQCPGPAGVARRQKIGAGEGGSGGQQRAAGSHFFFWSVSVTGKKKKGVLPPQGGARAF